jgi:hypothetical protein
VILLSNLPLLGGNVAAFGKRENSVVSPHIGAAPQVMGPLSVARPLYSREGSNSSTDLGTS